MNAAQAVAHYVARSIREFLEDDWNWGNSAPSDKHRSAAAIVARDAKVRERDVREGGRLLMGELYTFAGVRACRVCGCTDDAACEEGCSWVEADLCSACVPKKKRKVRRVR
jgi:hypothetical protein